MKIIMRDDAFEHRQVERGEFEISNCDIEGCDLLTHRFRDAFCSVAHLMVEQSKSSAAEWVDCSGAGLYLCKMVELETNSSVVQLMRKQLGVDILMNNGFYDEKCGSCLVKSRGRGIELNGVGGGESGWKPLSLEDAYDALMALLTQCPEMMAQAPWLGEADYQDALRQMAHFSQQVKGTSDSVRLTELREAFGLFCRWLDYLPDMVRLKQSLRVSLRERYEECVPETACLPPSPHGVDEECVESWFDDWEQSMDSGDSLPVRIATSKGLEGVAATDGTVLVPPIFDSVGYDLEHCQVLPEVVPVGRNHRWGMVATDGTGRMATGFDYDEVLPVMDNGMHWLGTYKFRKGGSLCWGLMDFEGREVMDCHLDGVESPDISLTLRRGNLYGVWLPGEEHTVVRPRFERIEWPTLYDGIPHEVLFTLEGERGVVTLDDRFVPIDEYRRRRNEIECVKSI